jgi:hypothetical protein
MNKSRAPGIEIPNSRSIATQLIPQMVLEHTRGSRNYLFTVGVIPEISQRAPVPATMQEISLLPTDIRKLDYTFQNTGTPIPKTQVLPFLPNAYPYVLPNGIIQLPKG